MDAGALAAWIFVGVAMILVGGAAASEAALASVSRSRVRTLKEAGSNQAAVIDTLLQDSPKFLLSLMLLKSSGWLMAGAAAFFLILGLPQVDSTSLGGLLAVWVLLAATQIVGRALVMRDPERSALNLAPAVQVLSAILLPLSFGLRKLGAAVRGQSSDVSEESIFLSEDGLRLLINMGEGQGSIEEDEKQMIASIFEMGETVVREIMSPRTDIIALAVDTPLAEALDAIIRAGHSRIPIFENNVDRIVGFLYAKDLLKCYRENQTDVLIRSILRPAYFVPESKKADELFHEMQSRRVHIAIVVDEYGGTAGLVTIEDLLEEIVGEIQDEYDKEPVPFQQIARDTYVFNARLDVDTVADLLGVDLPYADVDTLGGFIFAELGHVPETGETVTYAGWRFTVLSVESRRIRQVRAEPTPGPSGEDEPAATGPEVSRAHRYNEKKPANGSTVADLQTSS